MKITLLHWIIITLILIPLSAYLDTIIIGTLPFKEYLVIILWEAGLVWIGIAIGMLVNSHHIQNSKGEVGEVFQRTLPLSKIQEKSK